MKAKATRTRRVTQANTGATKLTPGVLRHWKVYSHQRQYFLDCYCWRHLPNLVLHILMPWLLLLQFRLFVLLFLKYSRLCLPRFEPTLFVVVSCFASRLFVSATMVAAVALCCVGTATALALALGWAFIRACHPLGKI